MMMCPTFLALSVSIVFADFSIPIPFGSLNFSKQPDGKVNVNFNQKADILGFGAQRNTTFTVGNGTFLIDNEENALVNGTKVGGQSVIGSEKDKGVVLEGAANLGNKTVQVGPGKESNFLSAIFEALSKIGKDRRE